MPKDMNKLAAMVVALATGQPVEPEPEEKPKNAAAVELGRLGGLKGGIARKIKLPKALRSEIARNAVQARWKADSVGVSVSNVPIEDRLFGLAHFGEL
jgi:hypothetical protein